MKEPAPDTHQTARWEVPLAALVLAAALALRLWNLDWGLPALYHPDEATKVVVILRMIAGESPDYFSHPGLLLNSAYLGARLLEQWQGAVPTQAQATLVGRAVSLLFGSAIVIPFWALSRRLLPAGAALFATALLAFSPMNVIHSRYFKEDTVLAFAIALVGWAVARCLSAEPGRSRSRSEWAVAACCGVCAASKFIGFIIPGAIALWILRTTPPGAERRRLLLRLLAGTAAVFLLITPQVFDLSAVHRDLAKEVARLSGASKGNRLHIWQWPDWGTYFYRTGVGPGMTWPAALVGTAGLAMAFRRRHRAMIAVAAVGIAFYVLSELGSAKRGVDRERYMMAVIPSLCILAAWLLRSIRPAPVRALAFVALAAHPAWTSWNISREIANDTRPAASAWLRDNGPSGRYRILRIDPVYLGIHVTDRETLTDTIFDKDKAELHRMADQCQVLAIESFATLRYERFPGLSKRENEKLRLLRERFPYTVTIARPGPSSESGFHNPRIEIRFNEASWRAVQLRARLRSAAATPPGGA